MKSLLPVIVLGLGILLLGLGFVWTFLFPATRTWTEEKANHMTELQNKAHKLLFLADRARSRPTPGGPSPSEAQANFDEAMAELAVLRKEFETVRDSPEKTGIYLRWAGSALALLGGVTVLAGRDG